MQPLQDRASLLSAIRQPRNTPLCEGNAAPARRGGPPVHMIKLTVTREITPYQWVWGHRRLPCAEPHPALRAILLGRGPEGGGDRKLPAFPCHFAPLGLEPRHVRSPRTPGGLLRR